MLALLSLQRDRRIYYNKYFCSNFRKVDSYLNDATVYSRVFFRIADLIFVAFPFKEYLQL